MNKYVDPPRPEKLSAWGFTKSFGYENAGWCCAEFSIAKRNGTIVNLEDADVQRVLHTRVWPTTAAEYQAMMYDDEEPVLFTNKGDKEAVRFNFFKHAYSLLGT